MSIFRRILAALFGTSHPPPRRPRRPFERTDPTETRSQSSRKPPRKPPRKGLDKALRAPDLTPLSHSEIKRQLRGRGSSSWTIFGNGLWWRRDLIPPSTDERTQLINRGMIGQGLVQADEVAELHRIGDEMLRLKPKLDGARSAGDAAVQLDKQQREARKQQKKQEAAEKKLRHAEAVAHRKATDIIFLGRNVSKGLADRRANPEKLQALGLPVLSTPKEVADALDLSIGDLRWLAYHAEATERPHYVRFEVAKKSGGTRELAAPMPKLLRAQDWILDNILRKVPVHEAAHGFVPGHNTVSNARPHLQSEVVINCDLVDFFGTIHVQRVIGVFAELGYSPAAATVLALLCTESPRNVVEYAGTTLHVATGRRCLPQGASTSPAISNLIARRLDSRMHGIANKLDYRYTRYADDMTFSAASKEAIPQIGYMLARIRHITKDEGFATNEKKTRVQKQSASQRVTGIVVNNETPRIDRRTVRRLRAVLHQAQRTGLEAQNREDHPNFEGYVDGMIAYIHMVNPEQAKPLREALKRCRAN